MPVPDRLLDGIRRLDPLPATTQRLMEVLDGEDTPLREVAAIVEHDEAVAANILRVANSSFLATRFPIENLRTAVVRLGLEMLLEIVIGDHLRGVARDAPMYDLSEYELWLHSAVSGVAVQEISRVCGDGRIPRSAGIAALVHDIGKLIFVRELDADVRTIRDLCVEREITFVEAERELFGCDHAEVGAALAQAWRFPDEVRDAIALHHEPYVDNPTPILDVVVLSNLVAKSAGIGLGAEGLNLHIPAGTRERLDIDDRAMSQILVETQFRVQELEQLHQRPAI